MSIQLSDNFVLIGSQPFSLWVTVTTGLLHVSCDIQNSIILAKVVCYTRTQSDFIFCHFILPKYW